MKAEEVMTSPVTTIDVGAPLIDALRLMTDLAVSGLPVVDASGKLVGMLTEGDLLRRTEIGSSINRPRWLEYLLGSARQAREYITANSRDVKDLMSDHPITVGPDAELDEVASLMLSGQVKRLPVVRDGAVIGIISRSDLLRVLVDRLETDQNAAPLSDPEIQERLNAELQKAPWVRTGTARASVKDGVVELSGAVFHDRERHALAVAARRIPGVKAVHDRLSLVQPITGRILPPLPG